MNRLWWQGVAVSVLVHVGVLAGGWLWTLLSHPESPDPQPIEARLVAPQPEPETPEPEPDQPAPEAPEPDQPQPAESKPEPKQRQVASAKPEPKSEPEPEPKQPATKTPANPVPKKRVAKAEPEERDPEKAEPAQPEPKKAAPEQPEERDPILGEALSDKIAKLSENGRSAKGSLRQRRAVARFQEAVRSRVQGNWLVPPGLEGRQDLEATVRIALTPAGKLAAAPKVVASNGPGHFNSSVVRAVEKAAPFPMPDGPTQYFQNLELHFSPDMVQ